MNTPNDLDAFTTTLEISIIGITIAVISLALWLCTGSAWGIKRNRRIDE